MKFNPLALLLITCLSLSALAQTEKKYQGLLWEISGNGLEKPSYLYGTMHVSNRVAFHLSEDFFSALSAADVIALETNPEEWINHFSESILFQDYYTMGYRYNSDINPLYQSFIPNQPKQNELAYYIGHDQDLLNRFLYRLTSGNQDFEEDTFLDLFIFQAGKKAGKKIVALEDFEESFLSVTLARKYDKDAQRMSERQAKDILGDYNNWGELQEDAYRKGDLDLLDTMTSALNPGKYYRTNMLDVRNRIMADGMDSLMKKGHSLFTGVGAAHLPGNKGVINMLRQMGYTLTAKKHSITQQSINKKEEIDKVIYKHDSLQWQTEDGFVQLTAPATLTKLVSDPYQEYVYADMANGSFYSLRRVNTFGALYGLSPEAYVAKVDSLLFENIPGKINSKEEITLDGYRGYDIRNTTKKGDQQRYYILFTPLEILIFKSGGHKSFVESAQPTRFFNSIRLGQQKQPQRYMAQNGGFAVDLPTDNRIELYEGVFYNPNATFWVQAMDKEGDYFAVGERQFYDMYYIEEDNFELKYLVERIVKEEKLDLDTLFLEYDSTRDSMAYASFILQNKKGGQLYGQTHIKGGQYIMLTTTAAEASKREAFFNSFAFTPYTYPTAFETYTDTNYYVSLRLPRDPNNFEQFLNNTYTRSYYNESEKTYQGFDHTKVIGYPPTGEELHINLTKFNKYRSYEDEDDLWSSFKPINNRSMVLEKDSLLYSTSDSNYYSGAREYWYSDTNSTRIVHIKTIVENGAAFSILTNYCANHTPSTFITEAFNSFSTSGDTLFGESILRSRAPLLFADLRSGDSTLVYAAKNSINMVDYREEDGDEIIDMVANYKHKEFEREDRLNLLNRLAFTGSSKHLPYLEESFYATIDSSAYQFKILETIIDYNSRESNKLFLKLILDETPFTSNSYKYTSLFNEFKDSLEIADVLFPKVLELTDFEDYKSAVYGLLEDLVDSGYVKSKAYKTKANTILRYAKVAYKKQRATDEGNSKSSSNYLLNRYNLMLVPLAKKSEVKEHFTNVLTIKNKAIVASQLPHVYGNIDIPDTLYNYLAKEDRARIMVYEFLKKKDKLDLLDPEHKTQASLGKTMVQNIKYSSYDSLVYLGTAMQETKFGLVDVFFYKVQNEKDKMWTFAYVAVKHNTGDVQTHALIDEIGEEFNDRYDDLEEIKKDALKEIKIYERERVQEESSGYY
jgi:uncharacterized protein YbaP (TraB family)